MRPDQNGKFAGSAMTWTWQSAAPSGTAKLTGVLTVGASAAPWLHADPELNPATPSAPASFKLSLRENMRLLPYRQPFRPAPQSSRARHSGRARTWNARAPTGLA